MLLLDHTCSISRNQTIGTNGRKSMTALAAGVACLALPMSAKANVVNGWEPGKGYDFYFNGGQDVKVGDKLGWNGLTFIVGSVEQYLVPVVGHKHAAARQEIN